MTAEQLERRRADLIVRCRTQRHLLGKQVADIQSRLRGMDLWLSTVIKAVRQPVFIASAVTAALVSSRVSRWSRLSLGMSLAIGARRLYRLLRH